MLKNIDYTIYLLLMLSIDTHAQTIKQPTLVQTLPIPEYLEFDPNNQCFGIYFLKVQNENSIELTSIISEIRRYLPMPSNHISFVAYIEETWDMNQQEYSKIAYRGGRIPISSIVHDASSVTLNGKQIILEDSYLAYIVVNEGGYGFSILSAELSPSQKYAGGIILYYDDYTHGTIMSLWDAKTGNVIYREYPADPFLYESDFDWIYNSKFEPEVIDLHFTPDENYLITREFWDFHRGGSTPVARARMLDLRKWEFITVDRDVAFISDMRYMVTERDGLPSLVELESDTIIHQYQIDCAMTACCFSPDDTQVYITTIINKLHIFDSGLQSTAPCWEVY